MILLGILAALLGVVLSAAHLSGHQLTPSNALIIREYQVKFDLTSQTPIEVISLKVTNKSPQPIEAITILVPNERTVVGSVAEDAYGQPLTFTCTNQTAQVTVDEKKSALFRLCELKTGNPISPDHDFKVAMLKIYYNSFYVFSPRSINLFEDQRAKVTAYKTPASPYRIEKSTLDMSYGDPSTAKTEKYETTAPVNPLSPTSVGLHFPINIHFVQSQYTKRYIEISHWGNIYFKDNYLLHNRGAKLRGPFSTIDFNKGRKDTGKNAFKQETIRLPVDAWGLYYRDEIGNISTSTIKRESDHISVTLKPRFSLLGDWNCTWDLSYNVPTTDILKTHSSQGYYKFEYLLAHLLGNTPSDVYELSLAMPEGANILSYNLGGTQADSVHSTLSFSYLDFIGRPTLVFTFRNYVPRIHPDSKLSVEYALSSGLIWIEPLYLVIGLMFCFGLYLIFSKLDLSFGSEILQEKALLYAKHKIAASTDDTTKKAERVKRK